MDRLTRYNELGVVVSDYPTSELMKRLAEYEDTELTPEQMQELDKMYLEKCKEVNQMAAGYKEKWINAEWEVPTDSNYILLSFANFSVPLVGRYEEDEDGGAFYIGDEDESCVSQDLIVNAWMPLPKPYESERC